MGLQGFWGGFWGFGAVEFGVNSRDFGAVDFGLNSGDFGSGLWGFVVVILG